MAMIAANGRLPDKAPQVTLEGANKRQARIKASVEMTTVTKLLACGTGNMCRSCGKTIVGLTVWLIPPGPLREEPWPYGACRTRP